MPIYEYRCEDCGTEFEVKQGIDDEPLKECRNCSGPVHRLISLTSFTLKGNGWYSDGYTNGKSGNKKNGTQPDGHGATGAGKTEGASCSSTPATTTLGKDKD